MYGFCKYAYFFSDFLHFDMSFLLLTVTLRGYLIRIAYCLFFHFKELSCGLVIPFLLVGLRSRDVLQC